MPRILVRDFVSSLSFNGSSARVDLGDLPDTEGISTFSICAWVKSPGTSADDRIVSKRVNAANGSYILNIVNGLPSFNVVTTGAVSVTASSSIIKVPSNSWCFLVGVYDGSNITVYVNAVLAATAAQTGNIQGSITNAFLGANQGVANFFNGFIDRVEFYATNLSSSQIADLYYNGTINPIPVHRYKLDEGSGGTAIDTGSNPSNGAITNATYSTDVFSTPRTLAGRRGFVRDFVSSLLFTGFAKVSVTSVAAQDNLSAVSISCWIYATGYGGGSFGRIFHKGPAAVGYLDFSVNSGNTGLLSFSEDWTTTDPTRQVFYGASLLNSWHHVVATFTGNSGDTPNIYIDGVLGTSFLAVAASGVLATDSSAIALGNRTTDTARTFSGYIDDMRLYNRALSSDEVADLYYSSGSTSGLIGWWKFNEGSGATAVDSSSSGTNGAISVATYDTNVFSKKRTLASGRTLVT